MQFRTHFTIRNEQRRHDLYCKKHLIAAKFATELGKKKDLR